MHISHVQPTNILIKGTGTVKHPTSNGLWDGCHVFDIRNIPIPYILIERSGVKKHPRHVSDITYIPAANIAVKGGFFSKHLSHIVYLAYIPATEISIEGIDILDHIGH